MTDNFQDITHLPTKVLIKKMNKATGDKMIIIAGKCTANFDGRIKSFLERGDRLVIIKRDLSIIMHGPEGVKPLNWQKPYAGPIEFINREEDLMLFTRRTKTKEVLEINFSSLESISLWHAIDESMMVVYGDERDMVKYLVSNPAEIEQGFQIIRTEYSTSVGPVDIKGTDKEGNLTIIEVKKRNASPKDAHQLKRYVTYFNNVEKTNVRGILVAPDFPTDVKDYLKRHGLEWQVVHWKDIFPVVKRAKNKKLTSFFNNAVEKKQCKE